MCVRWAKSISPDFVVGNGVKQGGLFPSYCSIYINNLCMDLNSSGIRGYIYLRTAFINHLCYAYDLCLISFFIQKNACSNSYISPINMQRFAQWL